MHALGPGAEKPTAAVINAVGSIVPASARGRDGIRLRFAFSGSCFDHGGMNRQRGSCRQQKENRWQYFLPQHLPTSPVTDAPPNFKLARNLGIFSTAYPQASGKPQGAEGHGGAFGQNGERMCLGRHTSRCALSNRRSQPSCTPPAGPKRDAGTLKLATIVRPETAQARLVRAESATSGTCTGIEIWQSNSTLHSSPSVGHCRGWS